MQSISNCGSKLFLNLVRGELSVGSLLMSPSVLVGGVRYKFKRPLNKAVKNDPEGIKYHGFTYFPRYPGEKDEEINEASKLFAVRRIRCLKGRPYWERHIVEGHLKLASRRSVAIVKNSPESNSLLYRVKHLISLTPLSFPNGVPTHPSNSFMKENGEVVKQDVISSFSNGRNLKELESGVEELKKISIDGGTLKKRLSLQWQSRY